MRIIKTSYINFYKIEDILQFLEENKNITNAIVEILELVNLNRVYILIPFLNIF